METQNDLIRLIDQSGLAKEKTVQLGENLTKFFNVAVDWNDKIDQIVITDPNQKSEMKVARETRLMLRQYRIDAQKLIKSNRDELKQQMSDQILLDKLYLNAGKMISATFENLESKLEQKEKFAENWEREQRAILRSERLSQLSEFTESSDLYAIAVENMSADQFAEYLNGIKIKRQNEIEREQQHRAELEQQAFAMELKRRQSLLINNGFEWTGSVFKFETLELTPENVKEMTTEKFDDAMNDAIKLIKEIRAEQQRKIDEQNREIERLKQGIKPEPTPEPIQPEPNPEPKFETTPIEPVGNSDQLFDEYMNWIKKQRMTEQPFGAMSLEIDLIDKFEAYKVWAVQQIKKTFKK
jgi:hypothetical protein